MTDDLYSISTYGWFSSGDLLAKVATFGWFGVEITEEKAVGIFGEVFGEVFGGVFE